MSRVYKLAAIIVMLAMVLSCCIGVFADTTQRQTTALNTLLGYGIISDDESEVFLSGNTTRAEMATLTVKLLGLNSLAKSYYAGDNTKKMPFDDVRPQDDYAGYVAVAKDLGLIRGNGEGKFNPQQGILYEEAAKILIVALGYTPLIDVKAKYPDNIITLAYQLRLFSEANFSQGAFVSRINLYTMIYNSLDISLMENDPVDRTNYYINSEKSLRKNLQKHNEKYDLKGIVYANENNNFTIDRKIKKDEIIIENTKYYAPGLNTDDLVGKSVEFYADVKDDLKLPLITQIKERSNKNNVLILNASDIISNDASGITYFDKLSTKKKITLSENYLTTYNGVLDFGFKLAEYKKFDAQLKFIDNDDDSAYEMITVFGVNSAVVDHMDMENMTLYFKQNTKINNKTQLSLDSKDYSSDFEYKVFNINGDKISLEDLKSDTSVSISFSPDGQKIKIISVGSGITGIANEVSYSQGTIMVVDKQYKIAKENDVYKSLNVMVGKQYTFYLNSDNKVFYTDEPQSSDFYAFIINTGVDGSALKKDIKVKILTAKKEIKIYSIALPITIEEKTQSGNTIRNTYRSFELAVLHISSERVISFILNEKDEIKTIIYMQPIQERAVVRVFNDANAKDGDGDLIRTDGTNIFSTSTDKLFATDKSTAVFYVPDDGVPPFEERQYKENYLLKNDKQYKTQAFGFDEETQIAKAVMVYINPVVEEGFKIVDKTPFGMVKKITSKLSEEKEIVKNITIITSGKEYAYELASDCYDFAVGNSLKEGDVIQYLLGYDGRLSKIVKHFSLSNIEGFEYFTTSNSYFGKVNDIVINKLVQTSKVYVNTINIMDNSGNIVDAVNFPTNKKNIFKIDFSNNSNNRFLWANFNDLKTRQNNGSGNESYIFIWKNLTEPIFAVIINR